MLHQTILTSSAKLAAITAFKEVRPQKLFDISPIIHPQNGTPSDASRTFWSATANALYIIRQNGADLFGATPDFAAKLISCPDFC